MLNTILEFISEGNRPYIIGAILLVLIVLFIIDKKKRQKSSKEQSPSSLYSLPRWLRIPCSTMPKLKVILNG